MAGYNWAEGKSNNAVAAEGRGLSNATETAKACRDAGNKGVTSAFIKENPLVPGTGEWHHTSSMYNRTDYFDSEAVIEWLNTDEGAAELAQFKAEAKKARVARTTTGTVTWVEFEGSGRSKYGVEHRWSGEVMLKGKSIYFDGQRKLLSGNYIEFVEGDIDPDVVAANKALADEKAAAEARRVEALRTATEVKQRTPEERREIKREKAAKRAERMRELKRERAERSATWRRQQPEAERLLWKQLADRGEVIHGTVTWGPGDQFKTYTGTIDIRDGWAVFASPDNGEKKLHFYDPVRDRSIPNPAGGNFSITEHPINNENQEAA